MSTVAEVPLNSDLKKIVCRRIPVKLKQFARLLTEITENELDPMRLKAMNSQITRTKDMCDEYDVDATSRLLAKVQSQLQLDKETLVSQKPLLKRFVERLENHANRLQLGQINIGAEQATARLQQEEQPATPPIEKEVQEKLLDTTPVDDNNKTTDTSVVTETPVYQFQNSTNNSNNMDVAKLLESKLIDANSELIIDWCIPPKHSLNAIQAQLQNFGYTIQIHNELEKALESASTNTHHIVMVDLELLPDDFPETPSHVNLVLFSQHDNLENRLKGVRFGSSLFLSNPIDLVKLLDFLESFEQNKTASPFRVLVVEDSRAQAKYNDKILTGAGFEAVVITNPMELLNTLSNFHPEVILMDMQMPGCNGIELTQVLRQIEKFHDVPIVFLSAEENPEKQRNALTSGGNAFVSKPVKKEELLFMTELYARRTRNLRPHFAHDAETGLSSSALFKDQLVIEVERAFRQNDTMFMVLMDIDHLYDLNKKYGYVFGERAIQQLARMLRQRLRKTDCVGLFESQKVGVILNHCTSEDADSVLTWVRQHFEGSPINFEGEEIEATLSIGISPIGSDYDIDQLVKRCCAALKEAHRQGNNRLVWAYETPNKLK